MQDHSVLSHKLLPKLDLQILQSFGVLAAPKHKAVHRLALQFLQGKEGVWRALKDKHLPQLALQVLDFLVSLVRRISRTIS